MDYRRPPNAARGMRLLACVSSMRLMVHNAAMADRPADGHRHTRAPHGFWIAWLDLP
jgi:hypothetical protein